MRYTIAKIECTLIGVGAMVCIGPKRDVVVGRMEGQDDSQSRSGLSAVWCLA